MASDPANSLRISRDSAYTENPMDRENMEEIVKARLKFLKFASPPFKSCFNLIYLS